MRLSSINVRRPNIFYGWYIVGASALLTTYIATAMFSYGLFFSSIRSTFGWSSSAISAAFSFQRLQGGVAQPITGFAVDRFGARKMILTGFTMMGAGFVLLSRITELWHFYAAILIVSLGLSIGFGTTINTALVNWFRRHRGRALGIVWSGTGLAAPLVAVVAVLIDRVGWRETALIIGISTWVICLPLGMIVRHRPEPYGYRPDGDTPGGETSEHDPGLVRSEEGLTVKQAIRTRNFWILSVAIGLEGMVTSSFLIHQVAHLEDSGLSRATAGLVISGLAMAFLLGRVPYALLGDRMDPGRLLMALFLVQAVGIVAFAFADRVWTIGLFLAAVGISHGAMTPLRPAVIADYMGTRAYGSIMGVFAGPEVVGGVFGPLFMGWIFDWRGGYEVAIFTFAALMVIATPAFLWLRPPEYAPKRRGR